MTRFPRRGRLLVSTAIAGFALAAPAAVLAQAVAANEAANSTTSVGEVVVTGSLFRRTNVETPSPVTVMNAEQIRRTANTTIADVVRSIAADNSGTVPTAFSDGFAAGSSGVALRGLTVNSTLVLIDGLRTADYPLPDDGQRGFVDLNTIPFSAVERVEVLKDGASSIYGADAIGGVVNIIMKPTFKGLEADAEGGTTQHGGGAMERFTVTAGTGDLDTDHYNVYIDAEYQHDARILDDQRGFPYNTNDLSSIGGLNLIGGQPGNLSGSIYGTVTPATITGDNVLTGVPIPGAVSQPLRPCGAGTTQQTDGSGNVYCAQNFLKYTDIQPDERRWGVLGRFTWQVTPNIQAWVTASVYDNRTDVDEPPNQIEASTPENTNFIALPATLPGGAPNPNDPFAGMGEAALINYAFGDIPVRLILDNHMYRGVLGVKGDTDGWDWQVTADLNRGVLDTTAAGFIYQPQLIADVTDGTYNFVDPSANSAAVRNALAPTLHKTSTTDLDALDASATRDLWTLPGGPLKLAVGGQIRYEAMNNPDINTNNLVQGGDGAMQPAYAFGHRTVEGLFAELEAPIVKQLTVNVSGRYDHYSDVGSAFSPKVGVKFTPIRQLVLRGTYSQGFRAPSFSESGNSAVIGYVSYSPCPAATPAQATFDAEHGGCGSGNPYITTPYNFNLSNVGNPNIKPETSHSYTIGAIAEPIPQFSISVDYYHITKNNVIGAPNSGPILADYYAGTPLPAGVTVIADAPDPLYPNAPARPLVIEGPWVNSNSINTSGLDIDARAHIDLPAGVKWTSDLNVSDIFHFYYTAGGTTYDYVGTEAPYILSSGAGTPKWRGNWTNSFTFGRLNVTGVLYYISPIKETGVDLTGLPAPCLYSGPTGNPLPADCQIKAFWDFDLTGRYKINDHLELYAAIENLFDASAPLDPANYSGGYNGNGFNYNPTYEQAGAIGRAFRVGIHFKY